MMSKLAILLSCLALSAQAYDPPVGIPAPPFGIDQANPAQPGDWSADVATYYYVDRTHGSATDSPANRLGNATTPRLTIPTTLAAGSKVFVFGSGYTLGTSVTYQLDGTVGDPIYIIGVNQPDFTTSQGTISYRGSYFIVDGFYFENTRFRWGVSTTADADHVGWRNNEVTGWTGTSNTGIHAFNTGVNGSSYIVLYQNYIHHNGDSLSETEIDIHAVLCGSDNKENQIWILDSHHSHNGGDAVQIGSATPSSAQPDWCHHIYVGRNHFHHDRENAFDIKAANHVVISENVAHDYVATSSSSGEVFACHNNGTNIWVRGNTLYNARVGVSPSGQEDLYVLDNEIYNMEHDAVVDSAFNASGISSSDRGSAGCAINISTGTGDIVIAGNTIDDCDRGIRVETAIAVPIIIQNNLIGQLKVASQCIAFETEADHDASTVSHNIFPTGAGWTGARVQLASTRYLTLAAYTSAQPGFGANSSEADPLWVNEAARDFSLQATSPAISAGSGSVAAYTTFSSLYSLSITYDLNGTARDGSWDIGAHEYTSGGGGGGGENTLTIGTFNIGN